MNFQEYRERVSTWIVYASPVFELLVIGGIGVPWVGLIMGKPGTVIGAYLLICLIITFVPPLFYYRQSSKVTEEEG